jgi:hypothetical protein
MDTPIQSADHDDEERPAVNVTGGIATCGGLDDISRFIDYLNREYGRPDCYWAAVSCVQAQLYRRSAR